MSNDAIELARKWVKQYHIDPTDPDVVECYKQHGCVTVESDDLERIAQAVLSLAAERDEVTAKWLHAESQLVDQNAICCADATHAMRAMQAERDHALQLAAERYEEAEEMHATLGDAVQTCRPTIAALRVERDQLRAALIEACEWLNREVSDRARVAELRKLACDGDTCGICGWSGQRGIIQFAPDRTAPRDCLNEIRRALDREPCA